MFQSKTVVPSKLSLIMGRHVLAYIDVFNVLVVLFAGHWLFVVCPNCFQRGQISQKYVRTLLTVPFPTLPALSKLWQHPNVLIGLVFHGL